MEAPLQLCLWLAFQVEGGIPLFSADDRRWGEEVNQELAGNQPEDIQ